MNRVGATFARLLSFGVRANEASKLSVVCAKNGTLMRNDINFQIHMSKCP